MPTIFKPKRDYKKEPSFGARKDRMKIYNSKKWQDLRTAKLMKNPLDEIAELEGRVVIATDVHHWKTFMKYENTERDAVAFDYSNLVSLSKESHWEIHHGKYKGCQSLDEVRERIEALKAEETENQEK